ASAFGRKMHLADGLSLISRSGQKRHERLRPIHRERLKLELIRLSICGGVLAADDRATRWDTDWTISVRCGESDALVGQLIQMGSLDDRMGRDTQTVRPVLIGCNEKNVVRL